MSAARLPRSVLTTLLVVLLAAGAASAKPYTDTKKRFALELPAGWKLAPIPGDTSGMTFRRDEGAAFAMLRVVVRPLNPSETLDGAVRAYAARFAEEIGYTEKGDLPSMVGLFPGTHKTFTVFASGDRHTVRSIDVHAIIAFGHVHVLHFETLEKERKRFAHDMDKLVGTYEPQAGRGLYGPLIGVWKNDGDGPDLTLAESGAFVLGPLEGTFLADGGKLTLVVDGGREQYRYALDGRSLTLSSPNLEAPMSYTRSGGALYGKGSDKPAAPAKLSRDELIGRWRALDVPSTEPLELVLARSGAVQFGGLSGQWRYDRGLLTISSTAGTTVTYTVSKDARGRRLTLGGGDLDREILLERQ